MHRRVVAAVLALALVVPLAACGRNALSRSELVQASDLPGSWHPYRVAAGTSAGHLCGKTLRQPSPRRTVSTAYAVNPSDGPIMGERIEQYRAGEAATVLSNERRLYLPCEWTDKSGRWRMTAEPEPGVARDRRVFLVTNLDRADSFNYEVAMRSDDDLVLVVVNERAADRALVDRIVSAAWHRATGR